MRSKGYVPDVSLDQVDGVVRKQILRQVDRLMFEYQAQSREQRKWRGYREPENDDLSKRSKKVRFNPCSTEGRRKKKRSVNSCVDELAHRINVSLILLAPSSADDLISSFFSAHSTLYIELIRFLRLHMVHCLFCTYILLIPRQMHTHSG